MPDPDWAEIILHHSASLDSDEPDAPAIARYHVEQRGWRMIGYHFVCELVDGAYQVEAGRPLTMIGSHCPGHNATAIGICLVGNFSEYDPPAAQLDCAAAFVVKLMHDWNIPLSKVYPHRAFKATECPGTRFDMNRFRQLVERIEAG